MQTPNSPGDDSSKFGLPFTTPDIPQPSGAKRFATEFGAGALSTGFGAVGEALDELTTPRGMPVRYGAFTRGFAAIGESVADVVRDRWFQQAAQQFQSAFGVPFAQKLQALGQQYSKLSDDIDQNAAANKLSPEQAIMARTKLHDDLFNNQIVPLITQMHDVMAKYSMNNPYIAKLQQGMFDVTSDWIKGVTQSRGDVAEQEAQIAGAKTKMNEATAANEAYNGAPLIPARWFDSAQNADALEQGIKNRMPEQVKGAYEDSVLKVTNNLLYLDQHNQAAHDAIEKQEELSNFLDAVRKTNAAVPATNGMQGLTYGMIQNALGVPNQQAGGDLPDGSKLIQSGPRGIPPTIRTLADKLSTAQLAYDAAKAAGGSYPDMFNQGGKFESLNPDVLLNKELYGGLLGIKADGQPIQYETPPGTPTQDSGAPAQPDNAGGGLVSPSTDAPVERAKPPGVFDELNKGIVDPVVGLATSVYRGGKALLSHAGTFFDNEVKDRVEATTSKLREVQTSTPDKAVGAEVGKLIENIDKLEDIRSVDPNKFKNEEELNQWADSLLQQVATAKQSLQQLQANGAIRGNEAIQLNAYIASIEQLYSPPKQEKPSLTSRQKK